MSLPEQLGRGARQQIPHEFRHRISPHRLTLFCLLGGHLPEPRLPFAHEGECGKAQTDNQREGDGARRGDRTLVPADEFVEAVGVTWRTGNNGFVVQVALQVGGDITGGVVTARAVLFEALHYDPIEIAADKRGQLVGCGVVVLRHRGRIHHGQRAQAGRRSRRVHLADCTAHFIQSGADQALCVEWGLTCEQFIKEHPQAIDVAARVQIQAAHLGLFRADVRGRADELLELGVDRFVREVTVCGLGNSEINHLRNGDAIVQGDKDVGRLDVAMNDALLMGMLDGLTDSHEKIQSVDGRHLVLVAILRNRYAADQFHDKVRTASLRGARIKHLRDVRMVH